MENAFNAVSDDEPWVFYLSDKVGNSFYYASELLMQHMMIEQILEKPSNAEGVWRSADALFRTVTSVSRDLNTVLMGYLIQVIQAHFGEVHAVSIARVEAPDLKKSSIPFFTS